MSGRIGHREVLRESCLRPHLYPRVGLEFPSLGPCSLLGSLRLREGYRPRRSGFPNMCADKRAPGGKPVRQPHFEDGAPSRLGSRRLLLAIRRLDPLRRRPHPQAPEHNQADCFRPPRCCGAVC